MQKTVSNYKRSLLTIKTNFDKILGKVNHFHSNHREALNKEILAMCQQKNTKEIILMLERVIHHHYSNENGNLQKENISSKVVAKENLIKDVNIPSYESLNLTEHHISREVYSLF